MFNRRVELLGMAIAVLGSFGSHAAAGLNYVIRGRQSSASISSRTKQSELRWTGRNPKRTTPDAQRRAARKRRNIRKHPRCAK